MDPGSRGYWTTVGAYTVGMLLIQSFMGYGIDWFKANLGEALLDATAYGLVGIGAVAGVAVGWRLWPRTRTLERLWLGGALLLYGAGTLTARYPQERLHYLGYGILAWLVYFGLAGRTRHAVVFTALGGSAVGLLDELLQIVWPRRYFDWADVGMNVLSVLLGLLAAIPAWRASRRPAPPHRRALSDP